MNTALIYMETNSHNPYYNLAFEEYILCNRREGNYLLLWQNENTVVIGQNQNAEAEINRPFVESHKIHVVRRTTGGGAVYHDLGNLNYSFITDTGETSQMTMDRFTAPVVKALRNLGLDAEVSGRNDILIGSRKVSGTAQRVAGKRILHHGTLLFDSEPDMVAGALQADPEKFKSKAARSVSGRIGNIRDYLKRDMELPAFWDYLKTFIGAKGMSVETPATAELAEVNHLKHIKYDTWEWNFGQSPPYNISNKRRWNGGTLEVRADVEKGRIKHICFYGDFLSVKPLDEILDLFTDCPFQKEHINRRIQQFPVYEYFGNVTQAELLQTIFA